LRIAVQKFGGTSVATHERRSQVCEIISSTWAEGIRVIVVVSAIGRENDPYATDTLINMVKSINPYPFPRELDMIMSCGETISGIILANQLTASGLKATFFSGEQAGIVTDGNFGNAHVLYVKPERLLECLRQNIVPVVAGFQGVSENGELTTLGRGGSDTTASVLGVAVNAEVIDIFTDVEGIMTADPRIVEDARLLDVVTYNEICQLSRDGAKVVHPRSVEIAMQSGIPLRVRSTFMGSSGTLITHKHKINDSISVIGDNLITGIAHTSNISQIKIDIGNIKDKKGIELKVFKLMANAGISVDFINIQPHLLMFTVLRENLSRAQDLLNKEQIKPIVEEKCAKVAVVGAAMTGIPGVMATVMEAFNECDIPILQSGDSYTNIWYLVRHEDMEKAVKALHNKFKLGKK